MTLVDASSTSNVHRKRVLRRFRHNAASIVTTSAAAVATNMKFRCVWTIS